MGLVEAAGVVAGWGEGTFAADEGVGAGDGRGDVVLLLLQGLLAHGCDVVVLWWRGLLGRRGLLVV